MQKTIFTFIFISFVCFAQGQQFDKKLNKFRYEIVHSLKEYGEIANKNEIDSLQYKYLYSRKLAAVNSKIIYYEIGRMTDHGYKFLAVLNNNSLTVFPSMNFNADFPKIILPFEDVKVKRLNIFKLFTAIKNIYNYNANPPWQVNFELKNK